VCESVQVEKHSTCRYPMLVMHTARDVCKPEFLSGRTACFAAAEHLILNTNIILTVLLTQRKVYAQITHDHIKLFIANKFITKIEYFT